MVFDIEFFRKEVCEVVANVPEGRVITYGQVARLIGFPHHARRVGSVLRDVPKSANLPCHRVVNHQGRLVPGWAEQYRLLKSEGVKFTEMRRVVLSQYLWEAVLNSES